LNADLESALKGKSAKEWSDLFNKHGVPAGEVLSIPEILEHPQITERSLIKHFQTTPGIDREIAVVRAGYRLASGDPEPVSPPPLLGADTQKILEELGYDGDSIAKLKAEGAV
jgi:CoA:oxalate CoA-transferase